MIEIITSVVEMPTISERRYKKTFFGNKWHVIDTVDNSTRYTGKFEDVSLACHNLNKKHYRDNPPNGANATEAG